jgi:hypothetical protein
MAMIKISGNNNVALRRIGIARRYIRSAMRYIRIAMRYIRIAVHRIRIARRYIGIVSCRNENILKNYTIHQVMQNKQDFYQLKIKR